MRIVTNIDEIGVSVRDVDNWLARLDLRTEYEPTVRGRKRRFSYPNALELAFISAFMKAGVKASSAVAYANLFVDHAMRGDVARYFAFADNDPSHGAGSEGTDVGEWFRKFPSATSVCLIPLRDIAERVDAYFEQHAVEVD